MSYQALLFCPDDKIARVVTQVLSDLEFSVESFNEPFSAVKKITAEHFDAVVVDCDNEQNATLIFKAARNSNLNQTSLAVAVVEGQSGVAKAFRIGANLVLTKPINVEQSKGTLRVARGLLRKSEAGKPAGSAGIHAMPGGQPSKPALAKPSAISAVTPFKPMPAPAPMHSPVASANSQIFEVEQESAPKPDPTEAALFESIPDPSASLKTHEPASEVVSVSAKQYPWQPIRKPQANEVTPSEQPASSTHSGPSVKPTSGFAAAAVAPAKEKPVPPAIKNEPADSKPETMAPSAKADTVKHESESPVVAEASTKSSASPKLIAVAAVVILAIAGFFGWRAMHSTSDTDTKATVIKPAAAPVQPSTASQTPPQSAAQPVSGISETSASAPVETPHANTVAESKHSATPNNVVVANNISTPSTKAQETIVVKSGPTVSSGTVEQVSAPNVLAVATSSNEALPGIVSSSAPAMPKAVMQSLNVSQGVVQGLLVHKVQPVYPPAAMQNRREGSVQLQASISKDGNVTAVKVLNGDGLLARAASDAVKQWKYRPYLLNGQPIPIETQITVNFRLP